MREPLPPLTNWPVVREGAEDFLRLPSVLFGERVYRGNRGAEAA
jgi:hypothetical protein